MFTVPQPQLMHNQPLKSEKADAEIDTTGWQIRKENNKLKMTFLRKKQSMPNNQEPAVQTPVTETLPEDRTSQGQFGWIEFTKNYFPYLIRSGEQYVALQMLENKIFSEYTKVFNDEVPLCYNVEQFKMTKAEAQLLNEINSQHCDNFFGSEEYTDEHHMINVKDSSGLHTFLKFCYNTLVQRSDITDSCCGFIRVASENFLPFVRLNSKQYVPLFYLDGECKYLEERSLELKGWELAYLKLLCKIHGVRKSFIEHKSIPVVDLQILKRCYAPDTQFEEVWPPDTKADNLLQKPPPTENTATENNAENVPEKDIIGSVKEIPAATQVGTMAVVENAKNTPTLGKAKSASTKMRILKEKVQSATPYPLANNRTKVKFRIIASKPSHGNVNNSMAHKEPPLKLPGTVATNLRGLQQAIKNTSIWSASVNIMKPLTLNNNTGCNFFQIPELPFRTYGTPYFFIGCQVDYAYLKHCINFAPYDSTILLVALEDVSQALLKVEISILIKSIQSLQFNVFLPNKGQLMLLNKNGITPGLGLINIKDLTDNIVQLKDSLSSFNPL